MSEAFETADQGSGRGQAVADVESTLVLLSELRGAVRVHARGNRGGMRLEHDSLGPVSIDRTTFDIDLDANVGPVDKLQAADPAGGTTVTSVALKWGWGNPAQFAAIYRQRFGVPLSNTLRTGSA